MKEIFFLVGLPRAGNTLFGSLMNQNPDIAVTANSITGTVMGQLFELKRSEVFKNYPDHKSLNNLAYHVLDLYYKDWNQKYIIDRAPWGIPINLKLLKETRKNIKMIVLVRDVIEVLASFIRWAHKTPDAFINRHKAKTVEEKCDRLMRGNGLVHRGLIAIKHLLLPQNKGLYHMVEYDDLVNHPKRTIEGVYDFLKIPKFKHRFSNLDQFEVNGLKYDEAIVGEGLHTIKTNAISKSKYDAHSIIPESIINKYGRCNFWRG
tara:strand:- start:62 stop:847 length:786 start_codon:yes stop_codon:yes gene_type:complete